MEVKNNIKGVRRLFQIGFFAVLCSFHAPAVDEPDKKHIDAVNDSVSYDFIVTHLYQSVRLLEENRRQARALSYPLGEGRALSNLGLAYYFLGKYDRSAECYLQAFPIFEKLRQYHDLALAYGEFGYQLKRRDLSKAVYYMQLALALTEKHALGAELQCKLLDNYGVLQEMSGKYDSAFYFYNHALAIKYQRGDTYGIPYSLNKLAGLAALQKRFPEAFFYLRRSDEYRQKEKNEYGRAENYALWGDIYTQQGLPDSALEWYTKALTIAQFNKFTFLEEYLYERLFELYKAKRNYEKALAYHEQYFRIKDSTDGQKTQIAIADLELAYETVQKDKLIATKELELEQRTIVLLFVGSISLLLLFLVFVIYQSQKKKRERERRELELQNQLQKAELENVLSTEKLRISRELHDNIGARLTFLNNSIEYLEKNKKNGASRKNLTAIKKSVRSTLEELRNTLWALKSDTGTLRDLVLKIRSYVQSFSGQHKNLRITVTCTKVEERLTLSSAQMLNIFRIVQEALQNCLKHAYATAFTITFERDHDGGFSLILQDNGKGFNVNNCSSGNGLANMKTRCEESGGTFSLTSNSKGTIIHCHFPYKI